jgi:iron(III) transport system ATP-binding protein
MRTVIRDIQNKLKITTVYVTHDQEEAMAISDRIAVMKGGVIQQIGSPRQLYQRPENTFVASFIGRTNILHAHLECEDEKDRLVFDDGFSFEIHTIDPSNRGSQNVQVSVRPEDIEFVSVDKEGICGTVEASIFLGINTNYFIILANGDRILTIQISHLTNMLEKGEAVRMAMDGEKINIYSEDGKRNLILPAKGKLT